MLSFEGRGSHASNQLLHSPAATAWLQGGWVQTMPAGAAPVSAVISQAFFLIRALASVLVPPLLMNPS